MEKAKAKKKNKRSSIQERVGNTEAVRSFRKFGWGAYKISDVQGMRFTETKPCDIIAQAPNGTYVAVEGKMMKAWATLNGGLFRENQIAELDGATFKRKGRAFVFLYLRIPPNKKKATPRLHALMVFDWKVYRKRIMGKGVSPQELRDRAHGLFIPVERDNKGRHFYDLRGLLVGKGQRLSDEIW